MALALGYLVPQLRWPNRATAAQLGGSDGLRVKGKFSASVCEWLHGIGANI